MDLEKTKILAMGRNLTTEGNLPVQLKQGEIVTVGEFTYIFGKYHYPRWRGTQ